MYVLHASVGTLNCYYGFTPEGEEAYFMDKESPNLLKFCTWEEALAYAEEHKLNACPVLLDPGKFLETNLAI